MPGGQDDRLDASSLVLPGMYVGQVFNRNDPEGLSRVQVTIPGLIEPHSGWALPLGTLGGGSAQRGASGVPKEGADVAVFFNAGDPDEPYYLAGHWGRPEVGSEVPTDAQADPDVTTLEYGPFKLTFDEREGNRAFRIVNKVNGDTIEMDAEDNTLSVQATTGLALRAVGLVDIQGSGVQINGRVVLPSGDPI